jgi:UDP-glucuronate decarboxylase
MQTTLLMNDISRILDDDLPWGRLSGQRILVTGASGVIGSYLVRTLLALNEKNVLSEPLQVVAMVRDLSKGMDAFRDLANDRALKFLEWDLSKIAVPPIAGCTYILHAASKASPRFYSSDPIGTLMPNAVGTACLLQALTQNKDARGFLFISSSEVYGSVNGDGQLKETDAGILDPADPRACYAESKRLGETLCVGWNKQFNLPTYIVRLFHTYGPGFLPDDGRVFADFTFDVLAGKNIIMKSDGSARRAFCYVSDAIAGIFTVLLKGRAGIPYNVANPAGELSVLELARLLVSLYPEKNTQIETTPPAPGAAASKISRLVPDISRIEELGWRAEISPRDGFKLTIDSYGQ